METELLFVLLMHTYRKIGRPLLPPPPRNFFLSQKDYSAELWNNKRRRSYNTVQ